MKWIRYKPLFYLILNGVPLLIFNPLSVIAASSLAAWSLRSDAVLELRTSPDINIEAFYKPSSELKGDRIWIDLPGQISKPRTIKGSGPIKEVRLGAPLKQKTRLVVEFNQGIKLNPQELKLIGVSPTLWQLKLLDMGPKNLKTIGEGNIVKPTYKRTFEPRNIYKGEFDLGYLPNITQNKYLIVIDPGHGGPDSGAVGIKSLQEKDVVLDVSLQVANLLKLKGVNVILTRSNEVDLGLYPRVALANRKKATAFVSIHANASRNAKKDVSGIETFYFSGSKARKLATTIQTEVLKVSPGSPDRGVRRGRYFVIRRTRMPAALAEIGFVTGRLDALKLSQASHRRKVAFAIAKGIIRYLQWQD
tara:strand:+ start:1379 stop:2464 length:1086 start_codon:yes stop_codon:yes gene_type:complete